MSRLLLRGARLLDPESSLDTSGDLLVEGERIAAVGGDLSAAAQDAEVVNADGLCLAPGLVDMRVQLREPGAEHMESIETAGQAAYNVAPTTAGEYFTKINCFCFTEQHLGPGEKREMAVVFYVDPELMKDSEQDDLNTITLSYTFFPLRLPPPDPPPQAGEGRVGADGASPAGTERKI